jgi:hypothetical protein
LEEAGAKELISLFKSYFLNNYEEYLIKHLHGDNVRSLNKVQLKQHLDIYYNFIAVFDLVPFICDMEDQQILGHNLIEHNKNYLAETYMQLYIELKNQLKVSEVNRIKKRIVAIIRENTIQNTSQLNQTLCDLLQLDEKFRKELVETLKSKY